METMRGRNEGTIFRRKATGQWVAQVTLRNGKRVSRYAKDRDGAKAELAELLRLRDAGAPITDRIRLGAFLERWVSDGHSLAPSTHRKHEAAIRVHITPRLGHIRLSDLSPIDVNRALDDARGSGLHPQTVRHLRATLRRALADAVRDGLVTRNVGALSRAPVLHRPERPILDANQARILIGVESRYAPLWTILVTTGLRISEALGLLWSSVELGGNDVQDVELRSSDAGIGGARRRGMRAAPGVANRGRAQPSLTVRHQLARENGEWVRRPPKTAKGRRTIPLTPLGVEALRRQRAQQDADLGTRPRPIDGLVFTSPTGNPLHETNVVKYLARDLAAAGLPHVTCHDLRHSAATVLYSSGVDLETIADMLGHSSSRVTADLYRHRAANLQADAAARMQEALG